MSVEELEKAIVALPAKDRMRLRDWLDELTADEWDRQIEADIKAGKLDALADEAIAEHKAGLSRKL
ncbi:MAG: hypothetical protein JO256_06175 [Alphaproteobacteria bacterium]|nr:hypothetical protein [Alphaproteobacteria bacterium]